MIRLLENDSNARGALFARLVKDVFHALGYHEFRLGTPKAGRELDLWANHRVEARSALAECKATKKPIGGDAINKFVGALDMERHEHPGREIGGYVVSLGGFTAAALAQEEALPRPRVILLSSNAIERELSHARLIVSRDAAIACAQACIDGDSTTGDVELLAWEGGWVWCCYLQYAGDTLGYVFVHADGRPLGPRAASVLKSKDADAGGKLAQLTDLGPQRRADPAVATLRATYLAYVTRECGDITVDGLPADEHVGSQRISLEQLYVPLYVERALVPSPGLRAETGDDVETEVAHERIPIGAILELERTIAVLGPPGSGKSTLLKRLAVSYADPRRRSQIADDLPDETWLPLVIRCRQLPTDGDTTIRELLASLPLRGEVEDPDGMFASVVSAALADGDALVLIDGLDEIADDASRLRFVKQLRTFIGTYPTARVVVTSREPGFRVVAGAVSDVCGHYRVAAFEPDDIVQLTRAWHRLVVGDSKAVEREATELASAICGNARVHQLAGNPLLLTTLLLVRRWVGELPRKRTVLYAKAIEVLLMTWNVEGHEPIDLEEAIPQLAYVAYWMTVSERQSLSAAEIRRLLREAREEMPEVLAYARLSPGAFIERIEERSSLMSLSGHQVQDGVLAPMYEFKHLTFQEYLTAVACVEGYLPRPGDNATPRRLLEPHLEDSNWREVVPLAVVLAGRHAGPLVESLCSAVERVPLRGRRRRVWPSLLMLSQVLADEAMIAPSLVDRACRALACACDLVQLRDGDPLLYDVVASRYGEQLESVCAAEYHGSWHEYAPPVSSSYARVLVMRRLEIDGQLASDAVERIQAELACATDERALARGSLMAVRLVFGSRVNRRAQSTDPARFTQPLDGLASVIELALRSSCVPTHFAAAWAYAWMGLESALPQDMAARIAPRLLELWRDAAPADVQKMAAWAFAELPLWGKDVELGWSGDELEAFLREEWNSRTSDEPQIEREDRRPAALMAASIAGRPWGHAELGAMAKELPHALSVRSRARWFA